MTKATTDPLLDFFASGFYENFWSWGFDPLESEQIAQKSIGLMEINSGHILDWCGGWGRISIHLAKQVFKITILDFVQTYLDKAQKDFTNLGLEVNTICADCRQTPSEIQADHAICTMNSLGFLNDDEQLIAFQSLYQALKPGAKVLLDCMDLLFVAKNFDPHQEKIGPNGNKYIRTSELDLRTSTLRSSFKIKNAKDETQAAKSFTQRIYTPLELAGLLEKAGFTILNMYGDLDGAGLSLEHAQIITLASKTA